MATEVLKSLERCAHPNIINICGAFEAASGRNETLVLLRISWRATFFWVDIGNFSYLYKFIINHPQFYIILP